MCEPTPCVIPNVSREADFTVTIEREGYETATPVYESMPGWSDNTFGVTERDKLPQAALDYIARIEALTSVPVDIISTGPDRVETMVLRHPFEG